MSRPKAWIPAILWAALLFFLSSLPSTSVPTLGIRSEDLVLHFLVYGVLGILLARAFEQKDRTEAKHMILAAVIGILYGASDEYHQTFVPGRMATISDVIADAVGVIVGILVYSRWRGRQKRRDAGDAKIRENLKRWL